MAGTNKRKRSGLSYAGIREYDSRKTLDLLLALDRVVVETSMRAYKISRRDRLIMREQNRRLHDAVRNHLPRILSSSRSQF